MCETGSGHSGERVRVVIADAKNIKRMNIYEDGTG